MANSWIKMREDLHEDPAVIWMAQQLRTRPEHVVGYCHRIWGLLSRQTGDGIVKGVSLLSLGSSLGLPGFPELMSRVGWLEYDESDPDWPVITIPKFERHLSRGAKKRADEAEKKRKQREKDDPDPFERTEVVPESAGHLSRLCPPKNRTREEKRREEEEEDTNTVTFPPSAGDQESNGRQGRGGKHATGARVPLGKLPRDGNRYRYPEGFADVVDAYRPYESPAGHLTDAYAAWSKLDESTQGDLMAAITNYCDECHRTKTKTMHVATFIRDRWRDYIELSEEQAHAAQRKKTFAERKAECLERIRSERRSVAADE